MSDKKKYGGQAFTIADTMIPAPPNTFMWYLSKVYKRGDRSSRNPMPPMQMTEAMTVIDAHLSDRGKEVPDLIVEVEGPDRRRVFVGYLMNPYQAWKASGFLEGGIPR